MIRKNRGFTLIELLLSLSIFSIVVVAIYSVFSIGTKARASGEETVGLLEEVTCVFEIISRDLRNSVRFSPSGFVGEADRMSFPAAVSHEEYGEICRVTYCLATDGDERNLMREKEDVASQSSESQYVFQFVDDIRFEYQSRGAEEGAWEWYDSWESSREAFTPMAVRIVLKVQKVQEEGEENGEVFSRTVFIPIGSFSGDEDEM